jgi:hypothetical protein
MHKPLGIGIPSPAGKLFLWRAIFLRGILWNSPEILAHHPINFVGLLNRTAEILPLFLKGEWNLSE